MLEPVNTAHVSYGIYNYDPDAEFGHLIQEDWDKSRHNTFAAGSENTVEQDIPCRNK